MLNVRWVRNEGGLLTVIETISISKMSEPTWECVNQMVEVPPKDEDQLSD